MPSFEKLTNRDAERVDDLASPQLLMIGFQVGIEFVSSFYLGPAMFQIDMKASYCSSSFRV